MSTPSPGVLDRLSRSPAVWNGLRWLAEAGFHGEHAVIARELGPVLHPGTRLLDLGCGTGQFRGRAGAARYVGVDLEPAYLRWAVAHRGPTFARMDGRALGFPAAAFDAALVVGLLHHLEDGEAAAVVAELARVLAPGAPALVMEDVPPPTRWNVPGRLMHALDRGDHIRAEDGYRALFAPAFAVERAYPMRSGICDYTVLGLRRGR